MFSGRDIGARVSVRRRLPNGQQTDVIGQLLSWDDGIIRVQRGEGEIVELDAATVVAGKTVPPPPPRRPPGVPHVSIDDMQRIANAGWPARETQPLGDWLMRAHGGITGRANSVMAVGDPGRPLRAGLEQIGEWYADRGLPPLLQLPEQSPLNLDLQELGWDQLHVTIVQTASIPAVLDQLPREHLEPGLRLRSEVTDRPDASWLSLMHDLDADDPAAHIAILTGPPVVGFVTLYHGDEPIGIGRVSIEGAWAGVTSVDVAPHRQRQGIGRKVMRVLLEWAAARGAVAAYLQVRAKNEPALALYRSLGFVTHHPYCYRALS